MIRRIKIIALRLKFRGSSAAHRPLNSPLTCGDREMDSTRSVQRSVRHPNTKNDHDSDHSEVVCCSDHGVVPVLRRLDRLSRVGVTRVRPVICSSISVRGRP